MSNKIAVTTTFPNSSWQLYAERMLRGFVQFWPEDIQLLVNLDDDMLFDETKRILRRNDAISCGWEKERLDFITKNKDKDHPTDYRKQAVRFCHKAFSLKHCLLAIEEAKKNGVTDIPRYLIWIDADVLTTSEVKHEDILSCLPKEGDAVSYLGRKDWDHSECGWLAFDLENGGGSLINKFVEMYRKEENGEYPLFSLPQWHDSYLFDIARKDFRSTNLTDGKDGIDIWPASPMAKFSKHYKGPEGKRELTTGVKGIKNGSPLIIQTKNSIPNEEIQRNILENQAQIKNWVRTCTKNDEELVVVSGGPMLIHENVLSEQEAGRKIVAVKHAIKPLEAAGIKPWSCILLDPRPHVNDFVQNPDTSVIWFVASQVQPSVVKTLLDAGCTVWGYHASVGANEQDITGKQPDSIVNGGSATPTRGLFLLNKLGFRRFRLYGYDLCFADKPNLDEADSLGQPKYMEISMAVNHPFYSAKKAFWSTPEFLAQANEISDILSKSKWEIKAFGSGIVPFMVDGKNVNDLRAKAKRDKIEPCQPISYKELLNATGKSTP